MNTHTHTNLHIGRYRIQLACKCDCCSTKSHDPPNVLSQMIQSTAIAPGPAQCYAVAWAQQLFGVHGYLHRWYLERLPMEWMGSSPAWHMGSKTSRRKDERNTKTWQMPWSGFGSLMFLLNLEAWDGQVPGKLAWGSMDEATWPKSWAFYQCLVGGE